MGLWSEEETGVSLHQGRAVWVCHLFVVWFQKKTLHLTLSQLIHFGSSISIKKKWWMHHRKPLLYANMLTGKKSGFLLLDSHFMEQDPRLTSPPSQANIPCCSILVALIFALKIWLSLMRHGHLHRAQCRPGPQACFPTPGGQETPCTTFLWVEQSFPLTNSILLSLELISQLQEEDFYGRLI